VGWTDSRKACDEQKQQTGTPGGLTAEGVRG
jgi:hypothetical protein